MLDLLGYAAGPFTGASVLAMIALVARVLGLKQLISRWSAHLEMRATARAMRAEGASDKQIINFMMQHVNDRAGRSP